MEKVQQNIEAKNKVILGIGAHPDDIDFGASATIAKYVEEGWDAYYIVCTDGSRGSADPQMTHEELAQLRRDEQRSAAQILGVKDVFFLEHTDTELTPDQQLKEEIVRIIRTVKPFIVIGIDPLFYYSSEMFPHSTYHFINHTDHRAAGVATMDAVFPLSRDRLTFPLHEQQGLPPHRVEELWLLNWGMKEGGHLVDVTSTMEKKLNAIQAHISQYDNFEEIKERMFRRAKTYAEGQDFEYAESFIRLIMP